MRVSSERAITLFLLAAQLKVQRRVAIDGADGAGKTRLAGELAELLGRPVLHVDQFLNDELTRYADGGPFSAGGHYRSSYDLASFREAVESEHLPLIAEGIFLFRPELIDLWDFKIYLFGRTVQLTRRAIIRDSAQSGLDVQRKYFERFEPAYTRYQKTVMPRALADLLIDNTDINRPIVSVQ